MNTTEVLYEMAVKTAFYNMDFCPGTNFYEVIDQGVLSKVTVNAQFFINELGVNIQPIDQYVVAKVLWGMSKQAVEQAFVEVSQ